MNELCLSGRCASHASLMRQHSYAMSSRPFAKETFQRNQRKRGKAKQHTETTTKKKKKKRNETKQNRLAAKWERELDRAEIRNIKSCIFCAFPALAFYLIVSLPCHRHKNAGKSFRFFGDFGINSHLAGCELQLQLATHASWKCVNFDCFAMVHFPCPIRFRSEFLAIHSFIHSFSLLLSSICTSNNHRCLCDASPQ